jgi:hypothetical protein
MKKFSILVLSIVLTSYSLAVAHTGNFEIDNLGIIPKESENLEVAAYSEIPHISAYGMDYSQRFVKLDHGYGGLWPSQFFDVTGSGGGLLSIAAPIKNERNSVPESSTMLLLGLGLVGLAGYGGRKKFKR